MLFYYGKNFQSSLAGRKLAKVICEQCRFEYYYELARMGTGETTAHYGIGSNAALSRSHDLAQRDLKDRMLQETEIVPCPACHWVNEDLILGYRRGMCRRWASISALISIIVGSACLIGAALISTGPRQVHFLLKYLLGYGLGGAILFFLGTLGLRGFLRAMVRPNRNFPLPTAVPAGSPPALIWDKETEQLNLAETNLINVSSLNPDLPDAIDSQLGALDFPAICCECLRPTLAMETMQQHSGGMHLTIPICKTCRRRDFLRRWKLGTAFCFGWLAISLPIISMLPLKREDRSMFLVVTCVISPLAAVTFTSLIGNIVSARIIDKNRGTVRVRFRNHAFHPHIRT